MPRIGYFKTTSVVDANQDSAIASILTRVGVTETALNSKADRSELSGLLSSADLSGLASKTELQLARNELEGLISNKPTTEYVDSAVAAKADASVVSVLSSAVDGKADASALVGLVSAADLAAAIANVPTAAQVAEQLGQKADKAAVDTRVAHENAFYDALRDAVFIESAPGSGIEFNYDAHALGNSSAGALIPDPVIGGSTEGPAPGPIMPVTL